MAATTVPADELCIVTRTSSVCKAGSLSRLVTRLRAALPCISLIDEYDDKYNVSCIAACVADNICPSVGMPPCLVEAEPHSKRLKVQVTIRKEVLNKVMLQQDAIVEVKTYPLQTGSMLCPCTLQYSVDILSDRRLNTHMYHYSG